MMNNYVISEGAFVVGDTHGCSDTLQGLLELANVNIDKDQVVLAGDFTDKGPQVLELIEFMERYGIISVRGNHENKLMRFARPNNKVQVNSEMLDTKRQLGERFEEICLGFENLPYYIPFEDSQGLGYLVHAGVSPNREIAQQDPKFLMMLRTWPFEKYEKGQPLTAPPWQQAYSGNLGTILHGHIPCESVHFHGNNQVYSLDGGAVYSYDKPWYGSLRGIRLGSREVFEIPGNPENTAHYLSL